MSNHPITPPPELIQKWCGGSVQQWWKDTNGDIHEFLILATAVAQWGADQELEACCEWLRGEYDWGLAAALRLDAERRPEPLSLKEQLLEDFDWLMNTKGILTNPEIIPELQNRTERIRRTLKAL